MTKGSVGETLQKGQKEREGGRERERERERESERQRKDAKKLTKKAGKSATAQGENPEISARKVLKTHKMPPTEHSKLLRKYKF